MKSNVRILKNLKLSKRCSLDNYVIIKQNKKIQSLKKIDSFLLSTLIMMTGIVSINTFKLKTESTKLKNDNSVIYSEEISEYDDDINDYASYVRNLGLNDLQIIMKVINDTWNEIDGYGRAENLIYGYYRLSFQEESKGVCTSFADDFTAKINAINPLYNARNLIVYLDPNEAQGIRLVNRQRDMVETSGENESTSHEEIWPYILGNHMVSLIDIPGQDITLMIDPTNLYIGCLKRGKIYILNKMYDRDNLITKRLWLDYITSEDKLVTYIKEYFEDFYNGDLDVDRMYEEYGYDAQQEALDYVRSLEECQNISKSKTY